MGTVIWLGLALVCVLAEIVSFNFVFASFAIGCVAAGVVALLPVSTFIGIPVFGLASVASLTLIRPAILKKIYSRGDHEPTGLDKMIGRTAVVSSAVSQTSGSITIDGETWSARSTAALMPIGTTVTITSIMGAMAIVDEVKVS